MHTYQITAVMPSLNEEKNLASAVRNVLEAYKRFGINGEVVIVNDGSTDGTGKLADEFLKEYPSFQVIHHVTPQGIGGSFWDGVKSARGEVVVMIPGDGENDAAEILRYLPLMDQVDMVVPFIYNRAVRSLGRRLLSIIYREIIKASFGLSLNYINGTVMYRRCIFEGIELRNGGFFYQSELLIKTINRGYLYAEAPCALRTRGSGDSRATTIRSLGRVAQGYLGTFREVHFGPKHAGGVAPGSVTARRTMELTSWNS